MRLISARQAIHAATSLGSRSSEFAEQAKLGVMIQKTVMGNSDGIVLDLVEAGRVLNAVDNNPSHIKDWLLCAYATDCFLSQRAIKNKRAYLSEFLFQRSFSAKKSTLHPRYRKLCAVAVDDMKIRSNNMRSFPDAYVCQEISVNPSNYKRQGWHAALQSLHAEIDSYDRDGLRVVSNAVKTMAE